MLVSLFSTPHWIYGVPLRFRGNCVAQSFSALQLPESPTGCQLRLACQWQSTLPTVADYHPLPPIVAQCCQSLRWRSVARWRAGHWTRQSPWWLLEFGAGIPGHRLQSEGHEDKFPWGHGRLLPPAQLAVRCCSAQPPGFHPPRSRGTPFAGPTAAPLGAYRHGARCPGECGQAGQLLQGMLRHPAPLLHIMLPELQGGLQQQLHWFVQLCRKGECHTTVDFEDKL